MHPFGYIFLFLNCLCLNLHHQAFVLFVSVFFLLINLHRTLTHSWLLVRQTCELNDLLGAHPDTVGAGLLKLSGSPNAVARIDIFDLLIFRDPPLPALPRLVGVQPYLTNIPDYRRLSKEDIRFPGWSQCFPAASSCSRYRLQYRNSFLERYQGVVFTTQYRDRSLGAISRTGLHDSVLRPFFGSDIKEWSSRRSIATVLWERNISKQFTDY
jgi:hypothetical protein